VRRNTPGIVVLALTASAFALAQSQSAYERKQQDGGSDAVRLFYLTHNETPQDTQDFANVLRAIAEVRRVYPYAGRRTIALRGTTDEIAMAEWIFARLDAPVDGQTAKPAGRDFPAASGGVEPVRVFYFTHGETPEDIQTMVNLLRTTADIQRMFPYNARSAIVLRARADQVAMAEWLFSELDKAGTVTANRMQSYAAPAAGRGDALRLFFFTNSETSQDLQEIQNMMRTTAEIQRLSTYPSRRAIALRGTADQVAMAEWIFDQLKPRK
jgi:hypothetical protein